MQGRHAKKHQGRYVQYIADLFEVCETSAGGITMAMVDPGLGANAWLGTAEGQRRDGGRCIADSREARESRGNSQMAIAGHFEGS